MPSFWALVTVKNGASTIGQSIKSLLQQTIPPSLVCIVDDGSTDLTAQILSEIRKENDSVHVITLEDKGYDSRRIVHNWNIACDYVRKSGREYDFLLISSDDVFLPENYVELLTREMENDSRLAVVSGSRGISQSDFMSLPEGAGRLIRLAFFKEIGYSHPPYYGYEPWLLYKAMLLGYSVKKRSDVQYEHARKFGAEHKFVEYGPAMRCLGYHPFFVLARVLRNILLSRTGISKTASLRMLIDYLLESKWKSDPYYHYFEPELRKFVRTNQKRRLISGLVT